MVVVETRSLAGVQSGRVRDEDACLVSVSVNICGSKIIFESYRWSSQACTESE